MFAWLKTRTCTIRKDANCDITPPNSFILWAHLVVRMAAENGASMPPLAGR